MKGHHVSSNSRLSLAATEQFNVAASLGEPTNNHIAADYLGKTKPPTHTLPLPIRAKPLTEV